MWTLIAAASVNLLAGNVLLGAALLALAPLACGLEQCLAARQDEDLDEAAE